MERLSYTNLDQKPMTPEQVFFAKEQVEAAPGAHFQAEIPYRVAN
jgi:hypothetical protein